MRYFLRRLVPGAARGRSLRNHSSSRLSFEALDARQLLAADAADSVEDEVAYVAPASVEEAPQKAGNASPTVSANSPLWGEATKVGRGGNAAMNSGDGYGGFGGYGFIPPEIINFGGIETTPGMWTFTGQVIDDEGVQGLLVHFGGLLEGHYSMVGENGEFSISVQFPPDTVGAVTAVVTDWDGITSEEVEWAV